MKYIDIKYLLSNSRDLWSKYNQCSETRLRKEKFKKQETSTENPGAANYGYIF